MRRKNTPIDTLRLTDAKRDALLNTLTRQAQDAAGADHGRKHSRVDFTNTPIAITFTHPGGIETRCLVSARNISVAGIGFLHGGYLHNGTDCVIELPTLFGETMSVRGRVCACRHLTGNVHEIGVQFDSEIDPYEFLEASDAPCASDANGIDLTSLTGAVLLIDSSPADTRLFTHHLKRSKIEIHTAHDFEAASEIVASGNLDIILIADEAVGSNGGADTIQGARMQGFEGPIIAMTADPKPERLEDIRDAGCVDCVIKPYDAAKLIATLAHHLPAGEQGGPASGRIHSHLAADPDATELLETYINDIAASLRELKTLLSAGQNDKARTLCLGIKGSGRGYGYPRLSDAAREVVDALETTPKGDTAALAVKRLELVARRLTAVPAPPAETKDD